MISCVDVLSVRYSSKDLEGSKAISPSQGSTSQAPLRPDSNRRSIVQKDEKRQFAYFWLHGTVGEELRADVLRNAFSKLPPTCQLVVLDIQTPGGNSIESDLISSEISSERSDRTIVAFVGDATSAGAEIALSCDHIFFGLNSTMGSATAWDTTTGSAVDKKTQSYFGSRYESVAAAAGHPPLGRAMVQPEYAVFYSPSRGLSGGFSADPPAGPDWVTIDSDQTVLNLDTNLARLIEKSCRHDIPLVFSISETSVLSGHKLNVVPLIFQALGYAELPVEVQKSRLTALFQKNISDTDFELAQLKNRQGLLQSINNTVIQAQGSDPDLQSYSFTTSSVYVPGPNGSVVAHRSRVLTPQSWSKWYASTDQSVKLWAAVLALVDDLIEIESYAEKYRENLVINQPEVDELRRRARSEILRLRQNRSRGPQQ